MFTIHSYFLNLLYPIFGINGIELVKYYIVGDEDSNPDQSDLYMYFLYSVLFLLFKFL